MANDDVKSTEVVQNEVPVSVNKRYLEKDVRLKVFVVGVGNAGNQVVVRAHKKELDVFAINSSIKDLSSQIVDDTIPSFIIGNEARGAGSNIEKGIELFKFNGRDLFKIPHFINKVQEADIIVVVGSFGGGTGAAVIPELCGILTDAFPKKIIIAYGITPKNCGSMLSGKNALITLNKIKSLKIPYMLDDLSTYENEPNDVAFNKVDDHIVECIKAITGAFLHISSSQMIDENDMKTLIGEPGYQAVYILNNVTSSDLDRRGTMQSLLIDQIKRSPSIMIQKDGIVKHMGIIINCPEDLMEVTKTGNYSEITNFIGGRPAGGFFENYNVNNETKGQFIVILSGMTFPQNRISQYSESVKKDLENANRVKEINLASDVNQIVGMDPGVSTKDKLSSDTGASASEVKSALDGYFSSK
jgi:cell division GTPase FtsZ